MDGGSAIRAGSWQAEGGLKQKPGLDAGKIIVGDQLAEFGDSGGCYQRGDT